MIFRPAFRPVFFIFTNIDSCYYYSVFISLIYKYTSKCSEKQC